MNKFFAKVRNGLYFSSGIAAVATASLILLAVPEMNSWDTGAWTAYILVVILQSVLYATSAVAVFAIAQLVLCRPAQISRLLLAVSGAATGLAFVVAGIILDPIVTDGAMVSSWLALVVAASVALLRWKGSAQQGTPRDDFAAREF